MIAEGVKKLQKLNLGNIDIISLTNSIGENPGFIPIRHQTLSKGIILFRARRNLNINKSLFTQLSDISMRKASHVKTVDAQTKQEKLYFILH